MSATKKMNRTENSTGGSLAGMKVGEDVPGRGASTDESLKPEHLLSLQSRSPTFWKPL